MKIKVYKSNQSDKYFAFYNTAEAEEVFGCHYPELDDKAENDSLQKPDQKGRTTIFPIYGIEEWSPLPGKKYMDCDISMILSKNNNWYGLVQ